MAYVHSERLTALDAAFLELENPNVHMHVGAVALFDAAPLRTPEGALDIERLRDFVRSALEKNPRFRQKIAWTPLFEHPVWVDDPRFNLNYHVRHSALPPPGDIRQLKRLVGRIMSQKLDRGKPLWEIWFVECVEGDRFAMVVKAHHCMVDGVAGVDILQNLMRIDSDPTVPPPHAWLPRPAPTSQRLLAEEIRHRAALPVSIVGAGLRAARAPREAYDRLADGIRSLGEMMTANLSPTSGTPLNPDVGPYRRFDWTRFELEAAKEVKNRLGGTLNDVVLAAASGAIRRFLSARGLRPQDMVVRAMVPVNIRTRAQRGVPGNRVANLLAPLPVDEPEPVARMARVVATTRKLKRSRLARGAEILEELSDRTFASLVVGFVGLASRQRAFNVIVTNIPGPPVSAYLLGAKMLEIYPVVPLFSNQALCLAIFSYDGGLYWGCNADWDAVPDLHDFVEGLELDFEKLCKAAIQRTTGAGEEPRAD